MEAFRGDTDCPFLLWFSSQLATEDTVEDLWFVLVAEMIDNTVPNLVSTAAARKSHSLLPSLSSPRAHGIDVRHYLGFAQFAHSLFHNPLLHLMHPGGRLVSCDRHQWKWHHKASGL